MSSLRLLARMLAVLAASGVSNELTCLVAWEDIRIEPRLTRPQRDVIPLDHFELLVQRSYGSKDSEVLPPPNHLIRGILKANKIYIIRIWFL